MPLSRDDLDAAIRTAFGEVYASQNEGATAPTLEEATILLESGLDSLGFAILVTQLEEELGFDPFSLAEEAFYPQSYGDFLGFYLAHQPQ